MGRRLVWAGLASLAVHWGLFQIPWSAVPVREKDLSVPYLELTMAESRRQRPAHEDPPHRVAAESARSAAPVVDKAHAPGSEVRPGRREVSRPPAEAAPPPDGDAESAMGSPPATETPDPLSQGAQEGAKESPSPDREPEKGSSVAKASSEGLPRAKNGGPATGIKRALPRYDINPRPEYPEASRRRGHQGTVVVTARVLRDGSAADVKVGKGSGHELLDNAAVRAVQSWRFIPATLNGEPVEMEVDIPIRFQLE